MPITARKAALESLKAYRIRGARPEIVLNNLSIKNKMDKRDTALASKIVNGVLQNMLFCDYYISLYSGRPISYFEPEILDVIRISVYQILFLNKIPDHAAVSEGVSLARGCSHAASGLVNSVLRKIASEKNNLQEISAPRTSELLSTKFSHPVWLVESLINEYGIDECKKILAADNVYVPVTAVYNPLFGSIEKFKSGLADCKIDFEQHPLLENAFYIKSSGAIDSIPVFKQGGFYIQDAAAYMSVIAADPRPGYNVLDVCSAPGGKSFAAAILMNNKGSIKACDLNGKKLNLVEKGAVRMGISIINTLVHDAEKPFEFREKDFDIVFADVPCSGTGVMRSKPEIRYKKPENLDKLPLIQKGILENSSRYVKLGGTLLYSTCSILKRENEDVVMSFLKNTEDFELDNFILPDPFGEINGMITILPYIKNTDGFFICKMKRKK